MALTTNEKQLSNRILNQMDSEKRRRLRKLTDTLEETASVPEIPGVDYRLRLYLPNALGALIPSVGSGNVTAVGTAGSISIASTNRLTRSSTSNYTGATSSTSSIGGFYIPNSTNQADTYLAPFSSGGGFVYKGVFGAQGVTVSTARMFVGYCSQSSAFTDADPSSLTNIIGIGFDAADTQVQFIHNDGSGVATKIPLGASFQKPSVNSANMYSLHMESSEDGSSVSYVVQDLIAGVSASGVVSTNLPASTTQLAIGGYVSAGGTSTTSTLRTVGVTEIHPNVW